MHELSAPYNSKSNGLAESAVKNVNFLLTKCADTDEDPHRALYEWRNIPRTDGYSPAQLLFGKQQYMYLPTLPVHHQFCNINEASAAKDTRQKTDNAHHDLHKSFLPPLTPGQSVLMQNAKTGLWDQVTEVTEMRPDKLSYKLICKGRELLRSRHMLRPVPTSHKLHHSPGPDVLHSTSPASSSVHHISVCDVPTSSSCDTFDNTVTSIADSHHQL